MDRFVGDSELVIYLKKKLRQVFVVHYIFEAELRGVAWACQIVHLPVYAAERGCPATRSRKDLWPPFR